MQKIHKRYLLVFYDNLTTKRADIKLNSGKKMLYMGKCLINVLFSENVKMIWAELRC